MNGSGDRPQSIYHITPRIAWEAAAPTGQYQGDTLASQGFIHCSTQEQVLKTANTWYAGREGLVLLEIDTTRVEPEIRYEAAPTGELFPHIYGSLDARAVIRVYDFLVSSNGTFVWPERPQVL